MIGVVLVTDPLGRSLPAHVPQPAVAVRAVDDRLPTTLVAKLIGVSLCLPDIILQAGERGSSLSIDCSDQRSAASEQ